MKSITVDQYQDTFTENLLSEHLIDHDSKAFLSNIVPMFNGADPLQEANDRFSIYRNNVILSLSTAIADTFPVVKRLIGNDCFNAAAITFVRKNPPTEPSLLFYGEQFINFIKSYPACAHLDYLSDVARLEWNYIRAFHAADARSLDTYDLHKIDSDKLADCILNIEPSVQLMQSDWPVDDIWEENIKPQVSTLDISDLGGCNLLIYRRDLQVQLINLTAECFNFLHAFTDGKSIAEAWSYTQQQQLLNNQSEIDDTELSGMLGYLLGLSVFTSVTLPIATET